MTHLIVGTEVSGSLL